MPKKIITHAPSKAYDEGWDAIFGAKRSSAPVKTHTHELGSCSHCDQMLALKELTRLTEEFGGYESEMPITRNSARCLDCGDEIVSVHRHDFVTCSCGNVSVDGGKDYLKRSYQSDRWEDTSER